MNNPAFWQAIDVLISESPIVIDRTKGSKHPRFDFVYPLDYGYSENEKDIILQWHNDSEYQKGVIIRREVRPNYISPEGVEVL